MSEENELNKMFRGGLTDPAHHPEYREGDWAALEALLDGEEPKRRVVAFWWPWLGSAAAVLLIAFGWMLFKPSATDKPKLVVAVHKTPVASPDKTDGGQVQSTTGAASKTTSAAVASNTVAASSTIASNNINKPVTGDAKGGATDPDKVSPPIDHAIGAKTSTVPIAKNVKGSGFRSPEKRSRNKTSVANNNSYLTSTGNANGSKLQENGTTGIQTETTLTGAKNAIDARQSETLYAMSDASFDKATMSDAVFRPQESIVETISGKIIDPIVYPNRLHFALSILAAPQLNGVGGLSQTQTGADVGLTFSAGFHKFTLSTGAMYAKAPYATGYDNYHLKYPLSTDPSLITADCRILDIPINLNYQVYGNFKNKFSVGTGLSSYLMLKESYFYTYDAAGATGPAGYSTENRNKHYFGVLNFDVLYQRRLNSKFSLDLQPYYKLPLTQIGYGHVDLQSAGVAVGFSWNIK